ncbi:hypothetical protein GGX14DRAFT_608176 [Mycena pura]|uniref:Uncharacterized protein n=1 Tax=Mycena pura TaxID=153505 RepID=A0AAD6YG53_9AGAR|nr:hypothetical protein GGX14DRAFT_608176 [Mycena pura]
MAVDDIIQLPTHQIYEQMPMDFDQDANGPDAEVDASSVPTVALPLRFIFVKHHPHAKQPNEIISLDSAPSTPPLPDDNPRSPPLSNARPWRPFITYSDYKFTSRCVQRRTPNAEIDEDLNDLHTQAFSSDCFITFRTHRDMEKSLAAARTSNISFCRKTLTIDFDGTAFGGTYEVEVEFRDPWQIMKQWVSDETLAPVSTWFSQEKYYCKNGTIDLSDQLYDEPWTGRNWKYADDSLPADDLYPSCYLGLHVWLDKGLVSTKVKMHPILFRGCWIHSATRNGSGNGGSALAGFVKMPPGLRQIDPNTLTGSSRSEYDRLKRMIYRGVCHLVMASLEQRSHHGEALRFGDGITRIAYPGVLIESMDFEELAAWLAIRNSMSLHPCPQCLAHKNDLPRLTRSFTKRTSESMSCALARAPIPKTERNEYLKQYGLHDFEHFLWNFNNSDPYKATGYDCLHFFDGGIWGRHMWPLIKGCLQRDGLASKFNTNMDKFPRWRDLKHFSSPTTIDYSDGQTFLDILKSSLPCIVQLLPANSCLVRLIRVMTKVRALLGLEVTLDSRLAHLHKFIAEYERICNDVSETHNKSLNFLKQHFLSHAINCFKDKGTSRNQNTRVGEGFQQEIAAQYKKTNGKDAEHQMSIMDENEETMARLDMKVDEWRKSQEDDEKDPVLPHAVTSHWKLGSADARMTSTRVETVNRSNSLYRDFNMRLREYLAEYHPNHPVHEDQNIEVGALLKSFVFNLASVSQVEPCKVLYVDFQSKVDWNNGRDILRCNPMFHGRQRYDSVIYEAQDDNLAMGQLQLVFRCHLPRNISLDLAMIRPYRKSSWAARTRTDCPMREWSPGSIFIALEHVTRGALLCPIFGAPREVFYVIDCVDGDMFLRVNNID